VWIAGGQRGNTGTGDLRSCEIIEEARSGEDAAGGFRNVWTTQVRPVTDLTARAITPAACEMMDGWTLCAVVRLCTCGISAGLGAVLLIEVEGLLQAVANQSAGIEEVCKVHHAREVRHGQGR